MNKEKILNDFKDNASVINFRKEKAKKDKMQNILQSTFAIILCAFSITGIVFAKDISKKVYDNFWTTGNGIGHAMEQGYIEKPDMEGQEMTAIMENKETGEVIEDLETSVKVDEFVMDDFNLSITFNVTLSDRFLEIAKAEDIWEMSFTDIVISDENDYILYHGFEKNKELDLESEKIINTGENSFLTERRGNTLKVIYNIYTGSAHFPKSKKLNIEFSKINISKDDTVATVFGRGEYTFRGDWKFSVDVPEKMYNRQTIAYKQKTSTNKDIKVTKSAVYETGMEVFIEVDTGYKRQKPPMLPEQEFLKSLPEDSEFRSIDSDISTYLFSKLSETPEYNKYIENERKALDLEVYLLNGNDERFDFTESPRENGGKHVDDNGILAYNAMFDLTKYDMTDEVRVVVQRNGKEDMVVLEREVKD